jgi:hypothetical protein
MKAPQAHARRVALTHVQRAARALLPAAVLSLLLIALLALPAVASAESCPNAVFRGGVSAHLPDCRAYEMVTPPYKEGYRVAQPEPAESGEAVIGESLGTFAGGESTGELLGNRAGLQHPWAAYGFARGASGWVTSALDPPASQFPVSYPAGWDPANGSSLWYSETAAQIEAGEGPHSRGVGLGQFVLHGGDGSIADVGPAFPPGTDPLSVEVYGDVEYEGATSDLSHVLFTQTAFHWPFDPSSNGVPSLYEYVGTGNGVPLLVGVNGGPGSTNVISRCGTRLVEGESKAERLRSLRIDGGRVFFIAQACGSLPPVNELFARIDNELPDAHTVAISEPSKEDCAACDTEEGVLASASFIGVSADASKFFFYTSQPLLGGDSSPNIYEYDFDSPGQKIVRVSGGDSTVSNPTANVQGGAVISRDGSHVYFVATGVLTKTPNSQGQSATEGAENLYVFERDAQYPAGRTAFIASVSPGGPSVSADGRFLAFSTTVHLTPDDTGSESQLFLYDAQTGSLVRASIGQNGYNNNGNSSSFGGGIAADDGAVFFNSVSPLVPEAVSGANSVYEYHEGSVYLISSGQDTGGGAGLDGVDASGDNVFFETQEQLLPQDGDSEWDVYDARVDGGFPPPAAPALCAADACQGPLNGAPVLLSPGSEFQAGSNPSVVEASNPVAKPKAKAKPKKKRTKQKQKARKKRRGRKASRASRAAAGNGGRS